MKRKDVGLDLPKSEVFKEREYTSYRDMLTFLWTITRSCNFECCYDGPPPKDPFPVIDAKAIARKLNKLPKPFRAVLTGGETLLVPNIIELCQRIIDMGGIIEMQTNFSCNTKEFCDSVNSKYVDNLVISFHPDDRRKFSSVEKFIHDLNYAKSKGFNIRIWNIDYPGWSIEKYLADCKVLHDAGFTPMRKRYLGVYNGVLHLGDTFYECTGKKCHAGCKAFCMWEDYSITPCEADRTDLGNLFTGFKLYDTIMPCKIDHCGCMGRELIVDEYFDKYYQRCFGSAW